MIILSNKYDYYLVTMIIVWQLWLLWGVTNDSYNLEDGNCLTIVAIIG